jgi:hypothetical protein
MAKRLHHSLNARSWLLAPAKTFPAPRQCVPPRHKQKNVNYRFVSDFPSQNQAQHILDDFEKNALSQLRANIRTGSLPTESG